MEPKRSGTENKKREPKRSGTGTVRNGNGNGTVTGTVQERKIYSKTNTLNKY